MKKYKKSPTKLLQIRLSDQEYKEIRDEIKKSGLTYRAYLLVLMKSK